VTEAHVVPRSIDAAADIAREAARLRPVQAVEREPEREAPEHGDPLTSRDDDWLDDQSFADVISLPTAKRPVGRPRELLPTPEVLQTLRALARVQATHQEIRAVLGVSEPTLLEFLEREPIAREALETPSAIGKVSLRRRQIDVAMSGNASMLIWTGKQYLGQSDKSEVSGTLTLEHLVLQAVASREPAGELIEQTPKEPLD
jgi:hypothetical protein